MCIITRLVDKIFLPSFDFRYLPQVLLNFASTYVDNEPFCTVLLASQVVMIQSLQPKGREFESTCVFFFTFIRFVWFHLS